MNKRSLKIIAKIIVSSALFFIPLFGYCWGITGHRVIAEIAEHHLTAKAKRELKKIIGKEPLAEWANWADFIKSDTTHTWDHASKWHYVNMPGDLSHDNYISGLQKLKGENLYTQIKAMTAEVKDKSLSMEKRKIALRFLIHLVGDLHQPLHVGREEDLGGNKIIVTWFGKPTNLHSVWDNNIVEEQQYSYSEYARILDIADAATVKSLQQPSLEEWFYDSYTLSNKVYATVPADGKLSYQYNYIFKNDLDRQLLKGGLRLAQILNGVLK